MGTLPAPLVLMESFQGPYFLHHPIHRDIKQLWEHTPLANICPENNHYDLYWQVNPMIKKLHCSDILPSTSFMLTIFHKLITLLKVSSTHEGHKQYTGNTNLFPYKNKILTEWIRKFISEKSWIFFLTTILWKIWLQTDRTFSTNMQHRNHPCSYYHAYSTSFTTQIQMILPYIFNNKNFIDEKAGS